MVRRRITDAVPANVTGTIDVTNRSHVGAQSFHTGARRRCAFRSRSYGKKVIGACRARRQWVILQLSSDRSCDVQQPEYRILCRQALRLSIHTGRSCPLYLEQGSRTGRHERRYACAPQIRRAMSMLSVGWSFAPARYRRYEPFGPRHIVGAEQFTGNRCGTIGQPRGGFPTFLHRGRGTMSAIDNASWKGDPSTSGGRTMDGRMAKESGYDRYGGMLQPVLVQASSMRLSADDSMTSCRNRPTAYRFIL